MGDTFTANYNWRMPEIGASANDWGDKWNKNLGGIHAVDGIDGIDVKLKEIENKASDAQTTAAEACAKAQNLDDVQNKETARANLGVAIGTNVQAYNTILQSLASSAGTAGTFPYFSGANAFSLAALSAYMLGLMNTANANDFRTALNLCQAGGTGASGTWGISITGNAATASNLQSGAGAPNFTATAFTVSAGGMTCSGNAQFNNNVSVLGAIGANGEITAYASDDRLKVREGALSDALSKISALDVFYYAFNDKGQELGFDGNRHLGLSAQQVREVLPEASRAAPVDAKFLTYQDRELIPLLVAGLQELSAKMAKLEADRDASE